MKKDPISDLAVFFWMVAFILAYAMFIYAVGRWMR